MCTSICQSGPQVNCSKTMLVELSMTGVQDKSLTAYCIVDEQSNATLVDERVIKFFGKTFPIQDFCLKFASQAFEMNTAGHLVEGLKVRGILEEEVIDVPFALSCPLLSDTTSEVSKPDIVLQHPHTAPYSHFFPAFDSSAEVLLLVGRNCGRAMATECLTSQEPYVHKTPLGYALVGNVCLDAKREVVHPSILRTSLSIPDQISVQYKFTPKSPDSTLSNPFETFADDDEPGLSLQNKKFLSILSDGITTTPSGNLQLPIPLKDVSLPTNKSVVFTRTKKTLSNLKNQPCKLESCVISIQKSLYANFIEEVPPNAPEPSRAWYLPVFCVQHPKKPKARFVYDASARYLGVSLNDCLYSGPDLNNQLRGVLLRFREQPIALQLT